MPTHQGIRIALVSQFDALALPEYHFPRGGHGDEPSAHVVDAHVPVYGASQFWIRYSCRAPLETPEIRFFYFKLYVAGKFTVAWSCGEQDGWKGKTIFVPDDSRSSESDGSKAPRRKLGLFFPDVEAIRSAGDRPALEIHVFRAKARKREHRHYTPQDVGDEDKDDRDVK